MTENASDIRLLRLEDVCVERGGRRLFSGLNAELAAGEIIALTGANGAGKTSLLRGIAGLLTLADGRILFEGPAGEIEAETARAEAIHLLAHLDGLKTARTAREELGFWASWLGGTGDVSDAVETFALQPLLDLEVRKLSAGQRRRLALSRLLAAPRKLWLLDEPMAPLDQSMRARMGDIMQAHLASGGMILAAVHDPLPLPSRSLHIGALQAPVSGSVG
jgi:heme exporter protein A